MYLHKTLLKLLVLSIGILFTNNCVNSKGHNIVFKFKNTKGKTAILGHYYGKALIPDDTVKVNNNGVGRFIGKKSYPSGMYFIVTDRKKVDFLLDENQHFKIETDTIDLYENLSLKNSQINSDFLTYRKNIQAIINKHKNLNKEKKKATGDKKKQLNVEIKQATNTFNSLQNTYLINNKNNFLGVFLTATKEISVPYSSKGEKGTEIDKLFQYQYYKKHFFDNINLSNAALLRTSVYEEKLEEYLYKVVPKIPDSLMVASDILLEKSRGSKETFRYVLNYVYNFAAKYAKKYMGFDALLIYIADKYYLPEADWASDAFKQKLRKLVHGKKNILIGKKIPHFELIEVSAEHFVETITDPSLIKDLSFGSAFSSYDIQTDFIVFYFWDPDCSKCITSAPLLHKAVDNFKKLNTTIIAVNLVDGEEGKKKWMHFINKHKLYDWINAWHPFNYRYKRVMDLRTTNQVFVVDKNKNIIAKNIHPTRLETFIKNYTKQQQVKKIKLIQSSAF